ncbi:DUF262 domain-containing protein [Pseudomonas sp. UM16]|uniref:DUF262 domain-containing protein n=1 Tax=Pseudomonas sp. UM16 TaxID=3158962 RepID=UPI0039901751
MTDYVETDIDEELIAPGSEEEEEPELLDEVMHPFNPTDIDIVVEPKSLDALIKRIQHNEIDMNTDFQRHAELWDNRKMSRLIESILIRFPLPAFYFDASDENNWLIVDGLQRLSTIRKFVLDKKLRLNGLEFLTELNGKTFDKLHRQYQRRIEECPVTVYMIKPGTPDDVKYSVFRRINTGGLTLNNQEIRNALAKPRDRELLEKLANLECSKIMLGDLSKRMKDQELVLRFWAFYRFDYLDPQNKKEIASFLDKAMEDIKKGDEQYRENFRSQYSTAIERCYQLLGNTGFEKDNQSNSRKRSKNSTLFEVLMVELAKIKKSDFTILLNKKNKLRQELSSLLENTEFFNSITYSTQKKIHVIIRYNKIKNLIKMVLND